MPNPLISVSPLSRKNSNLAQAVGEKRSAGLTGVLSAGHLLIVFFDWVICLSCFCFIILILHFFMAIVA